MPTRVDRISASPAAIAEQASRVAPPLWQLPLGSQLVDEMRLLSGGRLLVGLRRQDTSMSPSAWVLVDTASGAERWRYDRSAHAGEQTTVLVLEDLVLFRAAAGADAALVALSTGTGRELWSVPVSAATRFYPMFLAGTLLAIEPGEAGVEARAYSLANGSVRWHRRLGPAAASGVPEPVSLPDGVIHWYGGGAERFLGTDGSVAWTRPDVRLDAHCPPPQVEGDTLVLADAGGTLRVLRLRDGRDQSAWPVHRGVVYSNLVPYGRRVYLRGLDAGSTDAPFFTVALDRGDGRQLWIHRDVVPSVSNLLERDGRLYYATPLAVMALDLLTGEEVFSAPDVVFFAHTPFPVHLRSAGRYVVYVGELNVAGFDARTGDLAYRRGVTPLSQSATLAGLDILIDKGEQRVAASGAALQQSKGKWSDRLWEGAKRLQNEATGFNRLADQKWSSFLGGGLSSDGDYWAALGARSSAGISNAFAKAQMQMALFATAQELGEDFARWYQSLVDTSTLQWHQLMRQMIVSACSASEQGDYVYRPHSESTGFMASFSGVSLVRLSTGESAYTPLSVSYGDHGLWSVVDFDRGVVYSQGLGLDPAKLRLGEPFVNQKAVRVQQYDTFLIARPVQLP